MVDFVEEVEKKYLPKIRNSIILRNKEKLLAKFKDSKPVWFGKGNNKRAIIRSIFEVINEIAIVLEILSDKNISFIEYEPTPRLGKKQKSIDFLAVYDNNLKNFIDVKTIYPDNLDDWYKYEKHISEGFFPKNTQIILFRNGLGGEIYHNLRAARRKMLDYSLEFEEKIPNYPYSEQTIFTMVFCGNGSAWSLDDLEDFTYFYKNGTHRFDDPFSEMENNYIKNKNIELRRNINAFGYLDRKMKSISAKEFVLV